MINRYCIFVDIIILKCYIMSKGSSECCFLLNVRVNIMKSTGMVRGIDKMGRVVLPTETRKLLNLVAGKSAVEIYTDDDSIVLKNMFRRVFFAIV